MSRAEKCAKVLAWLTTGTAQYPGPELLELSRPLTITDCLDVAEVRALVKLGSDYIDAGYVIRGSPVAKALAPFLAAMEGGR